MRRWATWLLVGALVALGSVAVADALRGTRGSHERIPVDTSATPGFGDEPASDAMSGVLYYSDATDECRLAGLRMPELASAPPPKLRSCRFSVSPDGRSAFAEDVVWSPHGRLYARELGNLVELTATLTVESLRLQGRAPAFKPDGTFTYVHGNHVVEWTSSCGPADELRALPGDDPTPFCEKTIARFQRDGPVLSLVWLSNTRMAVITKPSEWVLTIREGRLRTSTFGFGRPLTDLEVSPRGNFVAVRAEGRGGLLVLRPDGLQAGLPPFTAPRAITWSPDERWTAVATRSSVFVFRTNTGEARLRRLPVVARDLVWR